MNQRLWLLVFLLVTFCAAPAPAAEQEQAMPEVLVEEERLVEEQGSITIKPEGLPAEVNVITKDDLKMTPYKGNYLDILRTIPGVFVSKYPGDYGDKIGMRGFAGGHGRQVAVFVDNMPMECRTFLGLSRK
jgi:outer membrane receptor for ferrienterochelin and colicin